MLENVIHLFDAALITVGVPLIVAVVFSVLFPCLNEKYGGSDGKIKSKR